ncbi:hypothetical protein NQ315_011872 [Exocentrus adspersus]|uniref:Nardilysin n=1 Tax=Exocentrus adspersus TaxID=1586481 RepID=A0AAV8W298_9CUCU|nr:hypothetical protein NQ315_011872 [Exocentrus adspersus]
MGCVISTKSATGSELPVKDVEISKLQGKIETMPVGGATCDKKQKAHLIENLTNVKPERNIILRPNMSQQNEISVLEIAKRILSCHKNPNLTLDLDLVEKCKSLKFEVLPKPVQSESDKKEYRVIKLENGLTACLISDKSATVANLEEDEAMSETSSEDEGGSSAEDSEGESDNSLEGTGSAKKSLEQKMAAAALCIGVGSFSDPKEVQGMAHFLEHMVFMGSEKFPEENDFDSFIRKGGGSGNASTDAETTCFYFECLEKHLYEGLDKFAQFFISPLMKKGAMTREREAIESEFQMALPSDDMRKEQFLCSLAKPDSPVNSFGWGNLKTLRDNVSDDKLYEGVHEFRKRHYSAHRMTLALQARLPMDVLEAFVLDCFCNVPSNNVPADDFKEFVNKVFDTPEFKRMYYVEPNKDVCQAGVDLTWSLPPLQAKYKSKPHHYIAHLIGDEGKGSLLSYLSKKVWGLATSIGNGESGTEHNSMYTLFTVSIVLTDQGLCKVNEVIEAVCSYMNLLRKIGPQSRIFDEIKMIADTSFKFSTEETAMDFVEDICESMQTYPPKDYIAGSELYYEYDPKGIEMIMEELCPEKMNIRVLTKTLPDGLKFDKTEKWFGTKYTSIDVCDSWLKKWKSVKPYPELSIPPPNPYLTTDFSILPETADHPEYPQKLISSNLLEMWYRKDQKFKLPLAYYYFYLISPLSIESPRNIAMLDIVLNMLVIAITEELYPATAADLSYSFAVHEKGLVIKVSGYNQKLPLVTEVISKYLITLNDHLTEDMFSAVKDKVIKSYHNKLLKPSNLDVRLNLLVTNSWTSADKHAAILGINLDEVKEFYGRFIRTLYVKVLVQGNVSSDAAAQTVNKFVDDLQLEPLSKNSYPKFRVVQVPKGEKCCRMKGLNETDTNSVITNYYQSGPFSIRSSVIIEIIMLLIEEPLFDILRTKEQLGYHVYCSIRDTFGILGYTVTVNAQANKFSTSYVDKRIEKFLKHARKLLSEMSKEELEQTKGDLIKTKQCLDVHLKEEMDRNWSEIIYDDYLFDRIAQEIKLIGDISMEEIREWWHKHNEFGNQENFRKLSIQIVGNDGKAVDNEVDTKCVAGAGMGDSVAPSSLTINLLGSKEAGKKEKKGKDYFIQNIETFKDSLYLYPPVQSSTANS